MTSKQEPKIFIPEKAVYTPQQVGFYGIESIKKMRADLAANRAILFPIAGMSDYVMPVLPGQTVALIAQTSNYKSGLFDFLENQLATQLVNQGRVDECIVHISVEETIEEISYRVLGHLTGEDAGELSIGKVRDWDRLISAGTNIGGIPIFRIGDSLMNPEQISNLSLSNIYRALQALQGGAVLGHPIQIAAIFVDYLQALPLDPEVKASGDIEGRRRLQVRNDTYRLRDMAVYFNCPVYVAVQAKQILFCGPSAKIQLPGMYDGEESSAIAQRFDRIITQWMPKTTLTLGDLVEFGRLKFTVTENLLLVKVAKQRGSRRAGAVYPCLIDYTTGDVRVDESIFVGPPADQIKSTWADPSPSVRW